MAKSTPVQRLRNLNTLLAAINPCAPEKASEIQKAVDFFINEVQETNPKYCEFPAFAREILNIHIQNNHESGLSFWNIPSTELEPLWLRSSLIEKLNSLRRFKSVTLVIFGLQESVAQETKYWTQKLDAKYEETRGYIETVAAEHQLSGDKLNLIYI